MYIKCISELEILHRPSVRCFSSVWLDLKLWIGFQVSKTIIYKLHRDLVSTTLLWFWYKVYDMQLWKFFQSSQIFVNHFYFRIATRVEKPTGARLGSNQIAHSPGWPQLGCLTGAHFTCNAQPDQSPCLGKLIGPNLCNPFPAQIINGF